MPFILTTILGLVFNIEWNFVGENKNGVITGKAFAALLIIANILNLILILLFSGLEKIFVKKQ